MFRTLKLQIILLTILICGFTACNSIDSPSPGPKPPVSSAPPNTSLPMPPLNGGSLNNLGWTADGGHRNVFSDFRGKVLVLDFYATWCAPCRRSIPHLVELQKKFADQGLQVIGLNVGGPHDLEDVPAFAQEFGIQYPLAVPDDELVSFLMSDSDAIPQTFIFDRQGQLAERLIGYGPPAAERIDKAIEAALQTPAP
ncbi:MAG: TlpA family protein disulfide reductase [Acidobacteria bacterium]|nr:TlpA family protein disulfide reductase [Acidobacteriota bacterium]MCA1627216.1 TlpA family protein disulfide reductase [Acidobacteriota bacterium]